MTLSLYDCTSAIRAKQIKSLESTCNEKITLKQYNKNYIKVDKNK